MRSTSFLYIAVIAALFMFAIPRAHAETRVVAYVPTWANLKTFSQTIDYASLTHINIAFENPTNDEGKMSFNKDDEFLIARAKANKVKVLVSIGGGSTGEDGILRKRYAHLLGDNTRRAFVAKLANFVSYHEFDGLDVDLEGIAIDDRYGAFIEGLSAALKPKGKLLTAAISKGNGGERIPDSTLAYFDFVNVMAYDAKGPWNPKNPGQHSSLEYAAHCVAYWLNRGLSKEQLNLGVPFYGYGFGDDFRSEGYPYAAIIAAHPGAEMMDQTGQTIWYNGIPTIKAKTQLVIDQKLGGVMIWSLDGDAKGKQSLLTAIRQTLLGSHP